MKILFGSLAVILGLTLCSATALAAGGKDKGDKDSGGNASGSQNQVGNQSQNQSDHAKNSDSDHNGAGSNSNSRSSKGNLGRENYVDRKSNLGDGGFDKHGIGRLDEKKYSDRKDNDWRYRHWGSEWWYWLPGGRWTYWREGRWHDYNVDTYSDAVPAASGTNPNSSNGPYYEDQNGFYTLQGNRKVYDPQIRREASPPAGAPSAPQG